MQDRLFSLWRTCGVGSRLPQQVLEAVPDLNANDVRDFSETLPEQQTRRIDQFLSSSRGERKHIEDSLTDGTTLICAVGHPTLADLDVPPLFLFARGDVDLLAQRSVAVVGTRKVDREGGKLTKLAVQHFRDHTIVSGGALGVDAIAHREALACATPTVSILPGDVIRPTPKTNARLFEDILREGGLLLSEYLPGTSPRGFHFHRRNQLIAALANEVVVVRADLDSGTMITADAATSLGRKLWAIPGSPLQPTARGPNALLATGRAEVLLPEPAKNSIPASDFERRILDLLPCTVAELAESLGSSWGDAALALVEMEMRGLVWKNRQTGQLIRS